MVTRHDVNHKERMVAGLPYVADFNGLPEERMECRRKLWKFNNLNPDEHLAQMGEMLSQIFGAGGETAYVEQTLRCDYGTNISVGRGFYANYNLTILDIAPVTIGDNVMIAPNVSIYTAGHPVHPESRNSGYEYGIPVTIGNNVWIGGSVKILPGVTIGDNCVIGGGSVVAHDIPANSIAVGNPARVVREITEDDREYYFKNRKFDVEDYK